MDHRRCALGRIAPCIVCVRLDAGLISPVNFRTFALRPCRYRRIVLLEPLLDRLRVLLVGPLHRLLRRETPPLQVLPHRPDRHLYPVSIPDHLLDRLPRPQRKGKLELVRRLVDHKILQLLLLLGAQRSARSDSPAPPPHTDRLQAISQIGGVPRAGAGGMHPENFSYLPVAHPILTQSDRLLPQFLLYLRLQPPCVSLLHVIIIPQIMLPFYIYLPWQ